MDNAVQLSLADTNPEYEAFVNRFKSKKTTDDCYTPEIVYNAVRDYVIDYYKLDGVQIVRPFWPGGDYERFDYPDGCLVLDYPPFSILSKIVKFYNARGINYFLFSPYLTCLNTRDCTKIVIDAAITYENGAEVNTAFITSLEPDIEARADGKLCGIIKQANALNLKAVKKQLSRYTHPPEVLTATALGYIANHGGSLSIRKRDCVFIRALDAQRPHGKAIFGAGLLLNTQAAAARLNAQRETEKPAESVNWELSDRERRLIKQMDESNGTV